MLNSTVLDVAIGLIFIYLLYSLLATTIKELLATMFSYRGRMLERGLEQMLDGVNYSYYWWNKLFHILAVILTKKTWENIWNSVFKNKSKSVGEKFHILINTLFTDKKYVRRLHKKAVANCKTSKNILIKHSKLCKKNSLFAAKITNHPLYLRSSEQSWLSKKPAYLAPDTFSDILIDIFTPNGNHHVLLKNIKNKVDKLPDGDLKKILNIYITQANGDLQRFKLIIENWYNDTMDRVTGWYKRQAFRILLIIGLILAIIFNVSTIEIVQKLSTDKPVRDAMIKSASDYVKAHKSDFDSPPSSTSQAGAGSANSISQTVTVKNQSHDTSKTDTTKAREDILKAEQKKAEDKVRNITHQSTPPANSAVITTDVSNKTIQGANKPDFESVKAGVTKINDLYRGTIQQENTTLGLGWGNYGFTADSIQWVKDSAYVIKQNPGQFKDPKHLTKILPKPKHKDPIGRFFYVLLQTIKAPRKWIGFLITALAISLGAPFWFDLLNKFINLRASGTKPDEDNTDASKTAKLNQKPDPAAKG